MKLVWASLAVCLFSVALFGVAAYQRSQDVHRTTQQSAQTHAALCTFKADLQRRYNDGEAFLEVHPNGIPGISRADIERSLANQKATLDSLAILQCEPEK